MATTPVSRSWASNPSRHSPKSSEVDGFRGRELEGTIAQADISGFIRFMELPQPSGLDWNELAEKINKDDVQEGNKRCWLNPNAQTPECVAFCKWVTRILELIESSSHPVNRRVSFIALGSEIVREVEEVEEVEDEDATVGTSSNSTPDGVCVLGRTSEFKGWHEVLLLFKVGRESHRQPDGLSANLESGSQNHAVASSFQIRSNSKQSRTPIDRSQQRKGEFKNSCMEPCAGQNATAIELNLPTLSPYSPTKDDLQLAHYAMKTISAVRGRTHVFGLTVACPTVVIWCFDRCGAIRSQPLDVNNPRQFLPFVQFISGILYAGDTALGFNPVFTGDSRTGTELRSSLVGVSVNIPELPDYPSTSNASLELKEVLARRPGLVGRGTLVHKAQLSKAGDKSPAIEVVLKSSWQWTSCETDWEVLKELREDKELQHRLVELYCGWEQGDTRVSDRWDKIGAPKPPNFHDRALRHTVIEYLKGIEKLSQPLHVPHIGWSILQAIKFLDRKGWFHGDISIGNMGVTTLECGGVLVKLHDFDLSRRHNSPSGVPRWMGTLPFMSIELLRTPELEYKIGFEVEALTWVLLWIVKVDGSWFSKNFDRDDIKDKKIAYLHKLNNFTNNHYKRLDKQIAALVKEWRTMWREQFNEREKQNDEELISESMYGVTGFLRIENWMKAQSWDVLVKTCGCGEHFAEIYPESPE